MTQRFSFPRFCIIYSSRKKLCTFFVDMSILIIVLFRSHLKMQPNLWAQYHFCRMYDRIWCGLLLWQCISLTIIDKGTDLGQNPCNMFCLNRIYYYLIAPTKLQNGIQSMACGPRIQKSITGKKCAVVPCNIAWIASSTAQLTMQVILQFVTRINYG